MTHDEPCSMAPDDKHDLISGTCSHLPKQSVTNGLSLLIFLSISSFHVSIYALKIAKRKSISQGSVMGAIRDTMLVNSSGLRAVTQGR
ncbi:hypothetical protein Q4S47_20760, partial [Aeromonas caviae]|uniref:hypothetical protein n=1 Tax=Aeromonas caviae TaxID=648 RepID=UPI003005F315